MENQQTEVLEGSKENFAHSFPDLSNDPFILSKEKFAIEFLTKYPIPKHLLPKNRNRADTKIKTPKSSG
ncbi:hypothetical protein SAMN05216327_110152 [Dyadobacter sp. SG02]|nr:hypothetical protein SAMN05216327_110152 [Dyadobacter sp. SG02]